MTLNEDILEKIILKCMLQDKSFLITVITTFETGYFEESSVAKCFNFVKDYFTQYNNIPDRVVIENSFRDDIIKRQVIDILDNCMSLDFNMTENYDYLLDVTNNYLKKQSIKKAIMDSVSIINRNEEFSTVRDLIEAALSKDIKVDIGLDYFGMLSERFKRIIQKVDVKVPTYFPQFDEYIYGGFPPYTLSLLAAAISGGKSQTMSNFAARQVLHGHTVVLMSLEMSQDMFAQRFDGILTNFDINKIYTNRSMTTQTVRKLKDLKDSEQTGRLFIKQYPTGEATRNDYRKYIRELLLRDIKPDIIYVDYVQLMKATNSPDSSMYSRVKRIAEELRALSFEFAIPVVSVSQLKPEARRLNLEDTDMYLLQESSGVAASLDFLAILGTNEDALVYENELHYRISKNRLGGRIGLIDKFYVDSLSLKMYDVTELDMWMSDASQSGDTRNASERRQNNNEEQNRRRR